MFHFILTILLSKTPASHLHNMALQLWPKAGWVSLLLSWIAEFISWAISPAFLASDWLGLGSLAWLWAPPAESSETLSVNIFLESNIASSWEKCKDRTGRLIRIGKKKKWGVGAVRTGLRDFKNWRCVKFDADVDNIAWFGALKCQNSTLSQSECQKGRSTYFP